MSAGLTCVEEPLLCSILWTNSAGRLSNTRSHCLQRNDVPLTPGERLSVRFRRRDGVSPLLSSRKSNRHASKSPMASHAWKRSPTLAHSDTCSKNVKSKCFCTIHEFTRHTGSLLLHLAAPADCGQEQITITD